DSLDQEVLDWLEENTKENEMIAFCSSSKKNLILLKKWGKLKPEYYRKDDKTLVGKKIRYYVLQRRPSGEFKTDRKLIENATPVYTKVIRKGGIGVWQLDQTPILQVFDFNDYKKAVR
ncbi:MAG: hypothetical protein ACRC2T_10415, partial [Thermoguttaceae bacterium]